MHSSSRFIVRTTLLTAAVALLSLRANADESPYCAKTRARASSDAALLYAPSIQAQGVKFPNNGTTDSGVTTGAGYQFRAVATLSPLDIYRGVRIEQAGDSDCEQHEATVAVQEVIAQGMEIGRLPALRRQATVLLEFRTDLDRIAKDNEERYAAKVTTLSEANEERLRLAELERIAAQVNGEVRRLEAHGPLPSAASLDARVALQTATTMEHERDLSRLRALDSWEFRISGGIVPQDNPIDYFAVVQVGFNFGAFSRSKNETRYLAAREQELMRARYEVGNQTRVFRAQLTAMLAQAHAEEDVLRRGASLLETASAALAKTDAASAPHALALLRLQTLSTRAQLAYVEALVTELSHQTGELQ